MGRIRTLLVDDDKEFYKIFEELIVQNNEPIDIIGYCHSGKECLNVIEQVGEENIDFLITDVQMADMGGIMLINQIKQKYSNLLSHILVISTYISYDNTGDFDLKQILLDIGVTLPPIKKPCDFMEIIENLKMYGLSILNSDKEQKNIEDIQALILNDDISDNINNNIEYKIKQLLKEKYNIIVDENIKMTEYLYQAILLAYQMKGKKMFVMKKIYNIITDEHNKEYPDDKVNVHSVGALIEKIIKERIDETYSVKSFVHDFLQLLELFIDKRK